MRWLRTKINDLSKKSYLYIRIYFFLQNVHFAYSRLRCRKCFGIRNSHTRSHDYEFYFNRDFGCTLFTLISSSTHAKTIRMHRVENDERKIKQKFTSVLYRDSHAVISRRFLRKSVVRNSGFRKSASFHFDNTHALIIFNSRVALI